MMNNSKFRELFNLLLAVDNFSKLSNKDVIDCFPVILSACNDDLLRLIRSQMAMLDKDIESYLIK
jgi:hypothetical protein